MPPGYPTREAPPSSSDARRVPPPWPPQPKQDAAPLTPPPWPAQLPDATPRTPPPWPPQSPAATPRSLPSQPQPSPFEEVGPYTPPPNQNSGYEYAVGRGGSTPPSTGGPLPNTFMPTHPSGSPRYVPGSTPPHGLAYQSGRPNPPIQPTARSAAPSSRPPTRMPLPRALRTDPTLYEWDRLSPEKKEAVLAAIRSTPTGGRSLRLARPLLIAALVLAMVLVIAGALFMILR